MPQSRGGPMEQLPDGVDHMVGPSPIHLDYVLEP